MNRDELFAQLEKLSPKEIQTQLSSWDKEELVLVHEFLKQKQSKEAQSDQLVKAATEASWAAMGAATRADNMATIAIVLSVGAMLAAVASAVVAFWY